VGRHGDLGVQLADDERCCTTTSTVPNGNILLIAWEPLARGMPWHTVRRGVREQLGFWPTRARVKPIRPKGGNRVDLAQLDHLLQDRDAKKPTSAACASIPDASTSTRQALRDKHKKTRPSRRRKKPSSKRACVRSVTRGGIRTIPSKDKPRTQAEGATSAKGANTGAKSADLERKAPTRSEERRTGAKSADTGAKGADTGAKTPTLAEERGRWREERARTRQAQDANASDAKGAPARARTTKVRMASRSRSARSPKPTAIGCTCASANLPDRISSCSAHRTCAVGDRSLEPTAQAASISGGRWGHGATSCGDGQSADYGCGANRSQALLSAQSELACGQKSGELRGSCSTTAGTTRRRIIPRSTSSCCPSMPRTVSRARRTPPSDPRTRLVVSRAGEYTSTYLGRATFAQRDTLICCGAPGRVSRSPTMARGVDYMNPLGARSNRAARREARPKRVPCGARYARSSGFEGTFLEREHDAGLTSRALARGARPAYMTIVASDSAVRLSAVQATARRARCHRAVACRTRAIRC